jgi:hypothetical protein
LIELFSASAVLSGKELFNYNSSLFVDDDAAIDAVEERELGIEKRLQEAAEEAKVRMEAERAQAEQMRLVEIQRIEEEECMRRDDERRAYARAPNRVTFPLGDVIINQVVFDVVEKEDLESFQEVSVAFVEAPLSTVDLNNEDIKETSSFFSAGAVADEDAEGEEGGGRESGDESGEEEDEEKPESGSDS